MKQNGEKNIRLVGWLVNDTNNRVVTHNPIIGVIFCISIAIINSDMLLNF